MKSIFILLFFTVISTAQTKKIDFFGTEFSVNNSCVLKQSELNSLGCDKNILIWSESMPWLFRKPMLSMLKNKLKNKAKEINEVDIKVVLFKEMWEGKINQFQKKENDTISNFVQLYGKYKGEERMIIMAYKTPKLEKFRIPACYSFLVN